MKGVSAPGAGVGRARAQTRSLRCGTARGTLPRRGAGRPGRPGRAWGQDPVLKHPRFAAELRAGPCLVAELCVPTAPGGRGGKAPCSNILASLRNCTRDLAPTPARGSLFLEESKTTWPSCQPNGAPPIGRTTPNHGSQLPHVIPSGASAASGAEGSPARRMARSGRKEDGPRQIVTTEIAPRRRFLRLW